MCTIVELDVIKNKYLHIINNGYFTVCVFLKHSILDQTATLVMGGFCRVFRYENETRYSFTYIKTLFI